MIGVLGSLLSDLLARGVKFEVSGDRLVVDAPVGALTETDRDALRATKQEILQFLGLERQILDMSLEQFEQSALAIEIRVPWLEVTLWWVPREEQVMELVRSGIERGHIYTAHELTNLTRLTARVDSNSDIPKIAQLKLAFNATVLMVDEPEPPAAVAERSAVARCTCHGTRFWRSVHGVVLCGTCHPPAAPELVAEWLDAPEHARG